MNFCDAVNFLYDLVPLKPWRALLIRAHFDRCPRCQKELAGAAEARSLFVQEIGSSQTEAVWDGIARSLAEREDKTSVRPHLIHGSRLWRWAAAGIVLVVLAGYWVRKDYRHDGAPGGSAVPPRFEVEYVRVGGQPADAYVYQPQGSDVIIVWAGRPN